MDVEAFKYPLIRSWRHALKLTGWTQHKVGITLEIRTGGSMRLEKAALMGWNTQPVVKMNINEMNVQISCGCSKIFQYLRLSIAPGGGQQ